MIAYVTRGKVLPKEIADQIVDRTDGVPLFIEELTKSVLESGPRAQGGGSLCARRRAAASCDPDDLCTTRSLRGSIACRGRVTWHRSAPRIGRAFSL